MSQESIGMYHFCQLQIVLLLLKEMWLQHKTSQMGVLFLTGIYDTLLGSSTISGISKPLLAHVFENHQSVIHIICLHVYL